MDSIKHKRVLLKITGEALKSSDHELYDKMALRRLVEQIKSVYDKVKLAVVIGGGNIIRGRKLIGMVGIEPTRADFMGMVATIINAMALGSVLKKEGIDVRVASALSAPSVAEDYIVEKVLHHLEVGRLVIIAGGTGHAKCTTDTAAIIRACELDMEIMMKGTKVSGVYDSDPMKNKDAILLPELSYESFLQKKLGAILDKTAVTTAEENKIPILVFNILEPGSLAKAVAGEQIGSLIS